ncbi:hypothetical protein ACKFC9_001657 [Campylobacter jejuni]
MSEQERELALFNLGKSLVELLGEEQAIADLTMLLERHPEMFSNEKEISDLIKKVVTEPEIIINNPTPRSEKDYIAGKKLNDKKMGEVGVRNDSGTNVIFHANEKRLKNLDLMSKKDIVIDGRDAHTPYTQAQSLDGRLVQKNISSITNENIIPKSESKNQPKTPIDFQAKFKEFTQKQAQDKNPSKDKERGR